MVAKDYLISNYSCFGRCAHIRYLQYYPFTVFGCLTFVRVYKPILSEDGTLKERKLRKFFFFVHDPELRSMFDSYKTICNLSKSGFKPLPSQITNLPFSSELTNNSDN